MPMESIPGSGAGCVMERKLNVYRSSGTWPPPGSGCGIGGFSAYPIRSACDPM